MDSGLFRYKIFLRKVAFVQDPDYGDATPYYFQTYRYAAIKWVQAKEKLSGGILSSVRQAVFTIRYSSMVSSINAKDVIEYGGDTFDIQSVSYKGQGNKAYIEIIAQTKE